MTKETLKKALGDYIKIIEVYQGVLAEIEAKEMTDLYKELKLDVSHATMMSELNKTWGAWKKEKKDNDPSDLLTYVRKNLGEVTQLKVFLDFSDGIVLMKLPDLKRSVTNIQAFLKFFHESSSDDLKKGLEPFIKNESHAFAKLMEEISAFETAMHKEKNKEASNENGSSPKP